MSNSINEVLWNDGEVISLADLHSMQRFLAAMLGDQFIGQLGSYNGWDDLAPNSNMLKFALTPTARQGYLSSGATRRLDNAAGMVCQWTASGAPDGLTPKLLMYQLAANELQTTFAANSSGNPRIDALCIKLDKVAGTNTTRDFEDASTHVVSSMSMNTRNTVVLSQQVVAGTPAAQPTFPTTPAGYCVYAYVLVPNGLATAFTHDEIWDMRLPMKMGAKKVYAKNVVDMSGNWALSANGLYVQNTGSSGTNKAHFPLGLNADQRLIRCALHGNWATGGNMLANLVRFDPATGGYTTPGNSGATLPFALGPGVSGTPAMGNTGLIDNLYLFSSENTPGSWGNGWPSGQGAETVTDAAHRSTDLFAELQDLGTSDTFLLSHITVYYLF